MNHPYLDGFFFTTYGKLGVDPIALVAWFQEKYDTSQTWIEAILR